METVITKYTDELLAYLQQRQDQTLRMIHLLVETKWFVELHQWHNGEGAQGTERGTDVE